LLLPFEGPSVTTIHDLSFIRYPETHPPERVALLEKELPKSIAQADAIITDSEYIKSEVNELLGIDKKKIHVVPLGVSQDFRPYSQQAVGPVLRRYKLNGIKYLLTVATLEPRKNLNSLIDAYLILPKKFRNEYKLVIIGARGWLSRNLLKRIKMLVGRGDVIALGYIVSEDLPFIYSGAYGFVLPSIYEGFGLPVLEAMSSGTPVLTSTSSSMPEVAAGAAILTNAFDIEEISEGLQQLIEDDGWRDQAIKKGLNRSKKYTWEKCIENTVSVYKSLK
jgi:alpha-1,3-rhamnosyl/mannosyltransferase